MIQVGMWTRLGRDRMADIEKRPSDLTDEEWAIVRPRLPVSPRRGRKPTTGLREGLNALRYMARLGDACRMPPKDFPPRQRVYRRFR